MTKTIDILNEEFQSGDFSRFNLLTKDEQVTVMQKWSKDTWDKFRMQNTVSEEEVFEPIFKLIDNDVH